MQNSTISSGLSSHSAMPTILASWVLAMIRIIQSYGIDESPLLKQAGIDTTILNQHDARVPVACTNHLWRLAVAATGDESIAIKMPHFMTSTTLFAIDSAIQACATPRAVLDGMCRFSKVASTSVTLKHHQIDGRSEILFCPDFDVEPGWESMDAFLSVIDSASAAIFGSLGGGVFTELRMKRPAPMNREAYEKSFHYPIRYSCESVSLVYRKECLDVPLPTSHPEMVSVNEVMLSGYLAQMSQQDINSKVRSIIQDCLSKGRLSKSSVAKELHMSERSLSRRLKEVNISFRQLVEDVRHERAIGLIKQPKLSISEIALELGYFDTSSFSRSFQRWTGMAPGRYREECYRG